MRTTTLPDPEKQWDQRFRILPFSLLALATAVALATAAVKQEATAASTTAVLVLVVATAAWMWWWTLADPTRRADPRRRRVHYVGRTAFAALLTVLNPLFCIFAWTGFMDAVDLFRGRALWGAMGATSVVMAIGQVGGVPFGGIGHAVLFVALLMLNVGLAGLMGMFSRQMTDLGEARQVAMTELERVNADLVRALAENAALHRTVLEQAKEVGVREERQRLAREIHDTLAQSLAGVLTQLQAARQDQDPASAGRRVDRAISLARLTLSDARRSVDDLSPSPLETAALATALADLTAAWGLEHRARVEMTVVGDARRLHPEVEATLLRVAQEALTNTAKHAGASRVGVTLTFEDDEVLLDVRDDGVGFEPATQPRESSFGLRGMRQRTDRLAGALHIETRPGEGTAVSVRVPALEAGIA